MPVPGAAAPGAAAPGAAVPGPKANLPPPLVVDAQGREVDASGQPVRRPVSLAEAAAAKAGKPLPAAAAAAAPRKPLSLAVPAQEPGAEDARFFDPDISSRGMAKRQERRPRAALRFVEEGRFQKAAEVARLQAKFGDGAVRALERRREAEEAALAAGAGDANLVPLGTRAAAPAAEPATPIPDVEWWDARILRDKSSYGGAAEGEAALREDRITRYVEHPVQVAPPAEAPPPPPQPLKLTKQVGAGGGRGGSACLGCVSGAALVGSLLTGIGGAGQAELEEGLLLQPCLEGSRPLAQPLSPLNDSAARPPGRCGPCRR